MPLRVVPRRDRKLNRLIKRGEGRVLSRGETLYAPGDSASVLFLVRKGHLRLVAPETGEAERVVGVVGPGELAGDEALVPWAVRRTEARAGEETHLTILDGVAVHRTLQTAARTMEAYLQAKEEDLALARAMAGSRGSGGAQGRLAALLLHLAARMGKGEGGGTRISLRLTHQVLADLTGTHRSTVTTLLNDWIYEGWMEDDEGSLQILDSRALAALVEGEESPKPSVDPKSR